VVIRLKERVPSHIKPLADVRTLVVDAIVKQKTAAQLQELANSVLTKIRSGTSPEALAKEMGYKFAAFEKQDRFKSTADREILQFAFGMVRPAATPQLESFATLSGGQVVVNLVEAIDGTIADIDAQQFAGIKSQIAQQRSNGDLEAFIAAHSAAAKIKY
jgi:peptidyl-prolyl cis-trans isomerase D